MFIHIVKRRCYLAVACGVVMRLICLFSLKADVLMTPSRFLCN